MLVVPSMSEVYSDIISQMVMYKVSLMLVEMQLLLEEDEEMDLWVELVVTPPVQWQGEPVLQVY